MKLIQQAPHHVPANLQCRDNHSVIYSAMMTHDLRTNTPFSPWPTDDDHPKCMEQDGPGAGGSHDCVGRCRGLLDHLAVSSQPRLVGGSEVLAFVGQGPSGCAK